MPQPTTCKALSSESMDTLLQFEYTRPLLMEPEVPSP